MIYGANTLKSVLIVGIRHEMLAKTVVHHTYTRSYIQLRRQPVELVPVRQSKLRSVLGRL